MFFFFFINPTYFLDRDEFKERWPDLVTEISERDRSVIIVEGGKPTAELTRYVEIPSPILGAFKDIEIVGDIEGPMPVEWYTDPEVQRDEDWTIDGPMPASWFVDQDEDKLREHQTSEKVDVSLLHRHKVLTLDTEEFTAQLEEIVAAVSESEHGRVIIFDDKKPIVEITVASEISGQNRQMLRRMPGGEQFWN